MKNSAFFILIFFLFQSCSENQQPKPKSFLALDYPVANYSKVDFQSNFRTQINTNSELVFTQSGWSRLMYPRLKAVINITYRKVDGNLKELFLESEKLTFSHTIKADGISAIPFENRGNRTFGKLFEVTGDAASNIQFHLTDSLNNFVTGSLYFQVQPNFDSIEPALDYIRKDIVILMEQLEWSQ
jgi:gliding motility-associated lipoprotein GldD